MFDPLLRILGVHLIFIDLNLAVGLVSHWPAGVEDAAFRLAHPLRLFQLSEYDMR